MSGNLQCDKGELDLPPLTKYSMQWLLLNGWDKPESGVTLEWGTICRAGFIWIIGLVIALIPYSVRVIGKYCPALAECFILDVCAAIIDVWISAYLFNHSWKIVHDYQSKITEKIKKDFLNQDDIEKIYKLKKVCKIQSFTFFGNILSIIILILTSFVLIIPTSSSIGSVDIQDVATFFELLKGIQEVEAARNLFLYCASWSLFSILLVVVFPQSTFFDALGEELDYILATDQYTKIYMVTIREDTASKL